MSGLPPLHEDRGSSWGDGKARQSHDRIDTESHIGSARDRRWTGCNSRGNVNEVRDSDRLRDFIDVEKDYDTLCVRVEHTPDLVRDRHDNQCRLLIGADVVKFHPLLHFFTRLQPKERARSPDAKDIFEIKVGRINRDQIQA